MANPAEAAFTAVSHISSISNRRTMRCMEIVGFGPPHNLMPTERTIPWPRRHEVLIKVKAAGISRVDVQQRQGTNPAPAGASDIPGTEVAGEIVTVGTDCGDLHEGQKVWGLVTGGGYAEFCLIPIECCLPILPSLTYEEAAALPQALFTAWSNVYDVAHLEPEETILIHGGSGGLGSLVIQMVKAFGSRVITTSSTCEKRDHCAKLGADIAINSSDEDFVAVVRDATNGNGVNVILDIVGGTYLKRNLDALARDGRLIQIDMLEGTEVTISESSDRHAEGTEVSSIDLAPFLSKRLTMTGDCLRTRSLSHKAATAKALQHHVFPLIEAGKIKPCVHQTFPFRTAADAHKLMESGKFCGKLVLSIAPVGAN